MSEEDLYKKASEAYSAQNWDKVFEYSQILVKNNPNHIPARTLLTMMLIQQQNADEAMKHCKYLIKHDPQNAHHHSNLGAVLQMKGKIDEAIQSFARSLEIQEDPKIRGILCFIKTPEIPLVNIEGVDKSASSLLASVFSNLGDDLPEEIFDKETVSELSEIGGKMQDDILASKETGKFLKDIADVCIDRKIYAEVKDLLRNLKTIDKLKEHLDILESESGIKGRFAEFQHLSFVQFEKV
jgi:tetratricopeptide (TPR) repeat protein